MDIRRKYLIYGLVLVAFLLGAILVVSGYLIPSLGPFIVGTIIFLANQYFATRRTKTLESALGFLLREREELKTDLKDERQERQIKANRLEILKDILRREGIDTDYLVNKYGKTLRAIILVLTHFKAPKWNTEEAEQVIADNLDSMNTQVLQGATKVIPPSVVDQDIGGRTDLERWFNENVLDGRNDIGYKLELLALVDLGDVYGNDTTEQQESPWGMSLIDEIFDLENIIPIQDLIEILSRIEQISLKDELEDNIALLAVPYASSLQFDVILENQEEIQKQLGTAQQVANTDVDTISSVLSEYEIEDPIDLAKGIKQEADNLTRILSGENSPND